MLSLQELPAEADDSQQSSVVCLSQQSSLASADQNLDYRSGFGSDNDENHVQNLVPNPSTANHIVPDPSTENHMAVTEQTSECICIGSIHEELRDSCTATSLTNGATQRSSIDLLYVEPSFVVMNDTVVGEVEPSHPLTHSVVGEVEPSHPLTHSVVGEVEPSFVCYFDDSTLCLATDTKNKSSSSTATEPRVSATRRRRASISSSSAPTRRSTRREIITEESLRSTSPNYAHPKFSASISADSETGSCTRNETDGGEPSALELSETPAVYDVPASVSKISISMCPIERAVSLIEMRDWQVESLGAFRRLTQGALLLKRYLSPS